MNEEEIKEYLKRTDKLLDKLSGEDKDTLEWLIFGYNQCAKMLYEKENIIKEVREWAKKYSCQFTNDDGELVVSEISFNIQARPCDLFKILDKAGDSNERYFGNPQFNDLYDLIKADMVEKVEE